MSSREPTDLENELESVDYSGDVEVLSELRSEARETVEAQMSTINDIDSKASRILRLNIVLIGVFVSVASIAVQNGTSSGSSSFAEFVNIYTELGAGALILSTAFAAMTYTASELDVGLSSENILSILAADFSRREIEELLVKNYVVRINFNRPSTSSRRSTFGCTGRIWPSDPTRSSSS